MIALDSYLPQNDSAMVHIFTRQATYNLEEILLNRIADILENAGFDRRIVIPEAEDDETEENVIEMQEDEEEGPIAQAVLLIPFDGVDAQLLQSVEVTLHGGKASAEIAHKNRVQRHVSCPHILSSEVVLLEQHTIFSQKIQVCAKTKYHRQAGGNCRKSDIRAAPSARHV